VNWSPSEITSAEEALGLLSGKWVLPILRALAERPYRSGELHGAVGEVSGKVFYETLERLRERGLVIHETAPAHDAHYALTAQGRAAVRIASLAGEPLPETAERTNTTDPRDELSTPREDESMSAQQHDEHPSTTGDRRRGQTPWPVDISRTEQPGRLDISTPHPARMYDYFLGGKDNFAVDREAAERVLAHVPEIRPALRSNRAFLHRVTAYLAQSGITQFIELGSGLPTSPNVHEIAQGIAPGVRVAYVDNDPVVLAHDRALLSTPQPAVTTINADIRQPEQVLSHPELQRLIDIARPVAVLLVAVLHFIPGDVRELVTAYTRDLPVGSFVAISHGVSDGNDSAAVQKIKEIYSTATSPAVFRTRAQVGALFDGFELVEPGLVDVTAWRPTTETITEGAGWYVGALGRKP